MNSIVQGLINDDPVINKDNDEIDGKEKFSTDKRINDLYEIINTGNYQLLSLDIFDTTVWRKVPVPTDLFFLVAEKLIRKGQLDQGASPASFVTERINAERRARFKKQGTNEVTLEEIYAEFPRGFLKNITPKKVLEIEFQIEVDSVVVYTEIAKLVSHANVKGLKTAFVSDTYFTDRMIRQLTTEIKVDHIILSSVTGVPKPLGLHKYLLEETGLTADQVLHVGDNYMADVEKPGEIGIDCYWFRKFEGDYDEAIQKELPGLLTQRESTADDRGLTSLRSQIMNTCKTKYEQWGAGVLGPVLAGYCDWVAQRTSEEGIDNVLCLMREGEMLQQALQKTYANKKTHLCYLSRYSATKAAIIKGTKDEIARFIVRPSVQNTNKVIEQLGLKESDFNIANKETLSQHEAALLAELISETPALKKKVVRASRQARKNLIKHLFSLLDLDKQKKIAMLDLGYNATIQGCIQKILDHEKPGIQTMGFYWITGAQVYNAQEQGAIVEGWLAHNNHPVDLAHPFLRSPEIIEQCFMADTGSTLGHDNNGKPVLAKHSVENQQREQIKQVQQGMLKYCEIWQQHCLSDQITGTEKLKAYYQKICLRFITQPSDLELELFDKWGHDDSFGSHHVRTQTETELDEWDLDHITAGQLASMKSNEVYWPFGLASKVDKKLGDAVAKIYQRQIAPDFLSMQHNDRTITFLVDDGSGFSEGNCDTREFITNHKNKVRERFSISLDNSDCKVIGFSVGRKNDLVGIKGINIHYDDFENGLRTIRVTHNDLEKAGYECLHNNVYLVTSDSPIFLSRLSDGHHFNGHIHVDVYFSLIEEGLL